MPASNAEDHAVVVGIDWYPGFRDLQGAQNDAEAFNAWLRSPSGGNLNPANIELILSHNFPKPTRLEDAQPVVSRVDAAFSRFAHARIDQGQQIGRRLYIFLAGHGFSLDPDGSRLLTAEARRGATGNHIPGRAYANWFYAAGAYEEIILLMDCCAEPHLAAPPRLPPWDPVEHSPVRPRRAYIFGASYGSVTRERFMNDMGKVRGLFSYALIQGLQGSAAIESGVITTGALEIFVSQYLPRLAAGGGTLWPRFEYERTRDIVFAEVASVPLTRVVIKASTWPPIEIFDSHFRPLDVLHDRQDPNLWVLHLGTGVYKATREGASPVYFEVLGPEDVYVNFN